MDACHFCFYSGYQIAEQILNFKTIIKLEPRILVEDKSKSYGDSNTENMLIHGDNLLALKALEKDLKYENNSKAKRLNKTQLSSLQKR